MIVTEMIFANKIQLTTQQNLLITKSLLSLFRGLPFLSKLLLWMVMDDKL